MAASTSMLLEYTSGAVSGVAGVIFGHPLDTLKVQLQVQEAQNKYKGVWDCIQTVHKQGMQRGFFRGMSWPVLSYGVVNSIFFGTYANVMKLFGSSALSGDEPHLLMILTAGAIGGVTQLTVATPVEVIKVVLQSQIPHPSKTGEVRARQFYKGPIEGVTDIIRAKGFRGMYRGLGTQAWRDLPASASYWAIFEFSSFYGRRYLPSFNGMVIDFVSGGIAGLLSWSLIMPFDVLKSRVQADSKSMKYRGLLDCAVKSFKEEGLSIFFRGYSVVAVRAFLVNAVTLLVYVECIRAFNTPSHEVVVMD